MERVRRIAVVIALHGAMLPLPVVARGLDDAVTANWSGIGLRDWAADASAVAGVPVVVDRRLDPGTLVDLDCADEPWREVLRRVAAGVGGEVAELSDSARIVAPGMAAVLAEAEASRARAIERLPARCRGPLAARQAWTWPAGSQPRDLLRETLSRSGLVVDGLDAVPHDHLPAATLPPLPLAARLDLVLAHYDLRIAWRAEPRGGDIPTGSIVPIDTSVPPGPIADRRGGGREKRKPRPTSAPAGAPTFSLRLAAPLDEALATLSKRWQLALDLDEPSLRRQGIAPGEIVRVSVTAVPREQVLDALLEPLGLAWKIEGDTLRVFAPSTRGGKRDD